MKAYELEAKITAEGHLELPDFCLTPFSEQPTTVKVIILVAEADEIAKESSDIEEEFSEESFKRSWQQAIACETVLLSQLWENTEIV